MSAPVFPLAAPQRAQRSLPGAFSPSANQKCAKQAVLYIHLEGTDYECRDCSMFIPGKDRCTIHGEDDEIREYGSCGLFVKGEPMPDEEPHGAVTKEQSGYTESEDGFSCKRCANFLPDLMDCKVVDKDSEGDDPGWVDRDACCNHWMPLNSPPEY